MELEKREALVRLRTRLVYETERQVEWGDKELMDFCETIWCGMSDEERAPYGELDSISGMILAMLTDDELLALYARFRLERE